MKAGNRCERVAQNREKYDAMVNEKMGYSANRCSGEHAFRYSAIVLCGRHNLREDRFGDVEELAEIVIPVKRVQVEQKCAACIRDVREMTTAMNASCQILFLRV